MDKENNEVSFLTSRESGNYITHEVAGQEKKFYRLSVSAALKVVGLKENIAKIVTAFMSGDSDRGFVNNSTIDAKEDITNTISTHNPVNLDTAKYREEKKQEAILCIFDSLQENMTLFATLILNSMREDFPRGCVTKPKDLIEAASLEDFKDMIVGVLKANEGVLGPFVQKVRSRLAEVAETETETETDGES